jgi:hypothetical protein
LEGGNIALENGLATGTILSIEKIHRKRRRLLSLYKARGEKKDKAREDDPPFFHWFHLFDPALCVGPRAQYE